MTTQSVSPQRDDLLWKQAKKRVGFIMHLRSYLIVNAGLWLIYLITHMGSFSQPVFRGYGLPWPLFAMIGWGIGLASHYFSVYARPDERGMVEREYEKLRNQSR
ncbi:2TM domain-containing protein [Spirosoma sp. 209]|uniref:2TM domain-containing protein n=1 Tax=Spirosoma sp. 209 TaxID=1955701 RepID=UPI00098D57CF|nr:2TM domain-containing protein [Spirosoma sp. 209]